MLCWLSLDTFLQRNWTKDPPHPTGQLTEHDFELNTWICTCSVVNKLTALVWFKAGWKAADGRIVSSAAKLDLVTVLFFDSRQREASGTVPNVRHPSRTVRQARTLSGRLTGGSMQIQVINYVVWPAVTCTSNVYWSGNVTISNFKWVDEMRGNKWQTGILLYLECGLNS